MEQVTKALSPGTMVGGRYRLERVLGIGGYGITYRGLDTRLDGPVAVKEYFPSFCALRMTQRGADIRCMAGMEQTYAVGMERFLREARTLRQLNHVACVVRVTDFFEENHTAYLVMEYLDGKNLKQMAAGFGGRIPPEVLLPAMAPIIRALGQVHKTGLIHRDVSPDNIMMLSDGTMRLIDFGNARDASSGQPMTLAMKEGFAPVEQYRTRGQGTWTDVYSVCATIYYCLTGKLPTQAFDRLTGTPLPTPTELGVRMPAWQEKAILDGLEIPVQQRIQDMAELWQRLYVEPEQPAAPVIPTTQITDPPQIQEAESRLLAGMHRIRSIFAEIYQKMKEL